MPRHEVDQEPSHSGVMSRVDTRGYSRLLPTGGARQQQTLGVVAVIAERASSTRNELLARDESLGLS